MKFYLKFLNIVEHVPAVVVLIIFKMSLSQVLVQTYTLKTNCSFALFAFVEIKTFVSVFKYPYNLDIKNKAKKR